MIAQPSAKFEEIPPEILRQIATVSVRMPRLYFYPIRFVRKFFWARLKAIHRSLMKTVPQRRVAIDFGCGSGVFLPTLANAFDLVQGIDIEANEPNEIVNAYKLENVRLINADIYNLNDTEIERADAIVAADVLEHFKELEVPIRRLHEWLKDDGYLFTSGPSENILTRLGRILGGIEKPWDHYHTGYEVEQFLEQHGFQRISSSHHVYRVMPMYILSVWKKTAGFPETRKES
jgi:predicted TPR repeat methyltransferase